MTPLVAPAGSPPSHAEIAETLGPVDIVVVTVTWAARVTHEQVVGDAREGVGGGTTLAGLQHPPGIRQHALAQAYIKTLLMKEASKSLQASSALGLEKVKLGYHAVFE